MDFHTLIQEAKFDQRCRAISTKDRVPEELEAELNKAFADGYTDGMLQLRDMLVVIKKTLDEALLKEKIREKVQEMAFSLAPEDGARN